MDVHGRVIFICKPCPELILHVLVIKANKVLDDFHIHSVENYWPSL